MKAFAGTEQFMRSILSRSINFPMRKPKQRMPKLNKEAREKASFPPDVEDFLREMGQRLESPLDDD